MIKPEFRAGAGVEWEAPKGLGLEPLVRSKLLIIGVADKARGPKLPLSVHVDVTGLSISRFQILRRGVGLMVKPMQLGHTNIRVSNLARSEEFYTEAIGLEVVSRRENGVNLSAREPSQEIVLREIGADDREQDVKSVGSNHLAWEMATFDDLQAICDQLVSKGIELSRVRSNSYSVGVYFNDPDGNSNEVYFEDVEAFRRRPEEGEYHRKLVGITG